MRATSFTQLKAVSFAIVQPEPIQQRPTEHCFSSLNFLPISQHDITPPKNCTDLLPKRQWGNSFSWYMEYKTKLFKRHTFFSTALVKSAVFNCHHFSQTGRSESRADAVAVTMTTNPDLKSLDHWILDRHIDSQEQRDSQGHSLTTVSTGNTRVI